MDQVQKVCRIVEKTQTTRKKISLETKEMRNEYFVGGVRFIGFGRSEKNNCGGGVTVLKGKEKMDILHGSLSGPRGDRDSKITDKCHG